MSWFSSVFNDIGGEFSHIFQSVGGEAAHVVKSVGGEVGTVYAHVIRPALPAIATVASAFIPGAQVATPYLISADVGLYGHAALTGGFHGLTEPNLGDYEAGAVAAATYGAGQAYTAYTTGGTMINSTQVLENLAAPPPTPLTILGNAAGSVYNTFGGLGKDLLSVSSLAGAGLSALNSTRTAVGLPAINILGQIQPNSLPGGAGGLPGAAQQAQSQQGGSSSALTGTAGGGIGLPSSPNNDLGLIALAVLGGAVIAS